MNTYSIIVNPTAGKGKCENLVARLEGELSRRKLEFQVFLTERVGHAIELARNAPGDIVVAVGGDGTVNEVANGIVGSDKTLGIIPGGSGNDLVKSIGIASNFSSAVEQLFAGKTNYIDYAFVRCDRWRFGSEPGNSYDRFFVNGVGIGFDAAVAERKNRIERLSGLAVYLVAVFQTLGKYSSPDFTITLDSATSSSRNLLIAIGNGRCAGGGFYLTPDAVIDDGFLDICLINEMSVLKILSIMPKVMKGTHTWVRGVRIARARQISVSAPQPFFVHADGEIVGRNVNEARVHIIEKALRVIVG